jgi:hypothetical protein
MNLEIFKPPTSGEKFFTRFLTLVKTLYTLMLASYTHSSKPVKTSEFQFKTGPVSSGWPLWHHSLWVVLEGPEGSGGDPDRSYEPLEFCSRLYVRATGRFLTTIANVPEPDR